MALPTRRMTSAIARALAALGACAVAAACSSAPPDLACPLLAPGGTALYAHGVTLAPAPPDAPTSASRASGSSGPGALVAHPMALAAGEKVKVSAHLTSGAGSALVIAFGPRDVFGGYPACAALSGSGSVEVSADAAGEWLVLVGRAPGEDAATYEIDATCTAGCPAEATCPTLADLGCADVRCDGELARDDAGCLTCSCEERALCGPDRSAGPGGSCILPACACPDGASDPVCGADGATYPSACHALCAGVPVAVEDACAVACPDLAACDAPCFGLRAVGADGCPTCTCLGDFAANPESCRACPAAAAPVCGSDGVTYRNRCEARCAGARVMLDGACVDSVTTWPAGCTLDCAHGLRPVAGTASALACDCAPAPTLSCPTRGAPICAALPGVGETTVASACVGLALGAISDGSAWGPCGLRCDAELPCPDDLRCQAQGFLAGRCLATEPPACGCSALVEPVCGADGATYDSACLAHCAGVAVAHPGACCDAGARPTCEAPEVARLDASGCATSCGEALAPVCAPASAITAPACDAAGAPLEGSACAAHGAGLEATTEGCP